MRMVKAVVFVWLVLAWFLVGKALAGEPRVLVKKPGECHVLTAGGGFTVTELVHPRNDGVDPGFSVAYVKLGPGKRTQPHRLLTSSQVYYILKGEALLHAGGRTYRVKPGMAVYLAPGVWQWVQNPGREEFAFLCVVSPPWRAADEEVRRLDTR